MTYCTAIDNSSCPSFFASNTHIYMYVHISLYSSPEFCVAVLWQWGCRWSRERWGVCSTVCEWAVCCRHLPWREPCGGDEEELPRRGPAPASWWPWLRLLPRWWTSWWGRPLWRWPGRGVGTVWRVCDRGQPRAQGPCQTSLRLSSHWRKPDIIGIKKKKKIKSRRLKGCTNVKCRCKVYDTITLN